MVWSKVDALQCAKRSQLEYKEKITALTLGRKLRRRECPQSIHLGRGHRVSGIEFSVVQYESRQDLTFRGTEASAIKDWMVDLKIRRRKWSGGVGRVHRGAADAVDSIWDMASEFLKKGKPISITGHSLGGLLATATSYMLATIGGWKILPVYTFGAPRAFNRKAADWMNEHVETWRVVNNNDIVTRIPASRPSIRGGGYKHTARFVYLEHDGDLTFDPGRWSLFLDRVAGRLDALDGGEPTIEEVRGLRRSVGQALAAAGVWTLRQAVKAEVSQLTAVPGVGPVLARKIKAWAEHRLNGRSIELGDALFDGTRDHSIGEYVRLLS